MSFNERNPLSSSLRILVDYNGNRRVITDIDYIYCVNYGTDMDLLSSENEVHQITTSVTNCSQNKVVTDSQDISRDRGSVDVVISLFVFELLTFEVEILNDIALRSRLISVPYKKQFTLTILYLGGKLKNSNLGT
ncbi:hypothetical protein GQR58_021718 [Nymphon striatum]|nr:hypothetical protein GQR58_021718 [Nymphon striatum]